MNFFMNNVPENREPGINELIDEMNFRFMSPIRSGLETAMNNAGFEGKGLDTINLILEMWDDFQDQISGHLRGVKETPETSPEGSGGTDSLKNEPNELDIGTLAKIKEIYEKFLTYNVDNPMHELGHTLEKIHTYLKSRLIPFRGERE